jgi:hypothetical protein
MALAAARSDEVLEWALAAPVWVTPFHSPLAWD